MQRQLTIQIVGYNGAGHLARAVEVLKKISKEEVIIRYIDNGSTDNSVEVVRQALPEVDIIVRGVNTGYAAAHNLGFSLCTTPYVLVHDQDVEIEWEGIRKLLEAFGDEKVGAVQGRLYRKEKRKEKKEERVFDSAGIVQTLALNGADRGANEEDRGQFDEPAEILAAQGACALFRMNALLEVVYTPLSSPHPRPLSPLAERGIPEIFDEDFFAYKEDVDLGWRLHQAGWKVLYMPIVMGYHARTLGKRGFMGWGMNPKTIWQRLSSARTRLSLRNYVWMVAKNASVGQLITRSPFIALRLLVFLIFSILYPRLFSVWIEILRKMPKMLAKRL